MAIVVPGVAANYRSPLVAIPSIIDRDPREGKKAVPVEVDWKDYASPWVVSFNLQVNSAQVLTQIVSLSVDNSQCGADIQFVFTDTSETLTIPAYTAKAIIEVNTRSLQFYLVTGLNGELVEPGYITRFAILNYLAPPVVIPAPDSTQEVASFNNITASAGPPADTQLIAAGINGSVENLNVSAQLGFAVTGVAIFQIKDGNGDVIAGAQCATASGPGQNQNVLLIDFNGIDVPFENGLVLHWVSSSLHSDSALSVNVMYRSP
jgi:hypothetical protein